MKVGMLALRTVPVGVACLLILTLGGCTDPGGAGVPETSSEYAKDWQGHYSDFESLYPDASEEARVAAGKALAVGELPYEEYHAAAERFMECAEAGGLTMNPLEEGQKVQGMALIGWSMPISANEDQAEQDQTIVDACYDKELALVEVLYKSQPMANDWMVQNDAKFRDAMAECLRLKGEAVDDGASMSDLVTLDMNNPATTEQNACVTTTGYQASLNG